MTLKEVKKQLFPAIYKTRGGELVEITGFAFIGHFLNNKGKKQDFLYTWDEQMNFLKTAIRYQGDDRDADLMEIVKSPGIDPNWALKKNRNVKL